MWTHQAMQKCLYCNQYIALLTFAKVAKCMYWLMLCQYVIGVWKTDQIVTSGLSQFIGPANSYTHALPMHSVTSRLS